MKHLSTSLLALSAALALTGCKTTHEGAYEPQATTLHGVESRAGFVLMDPGAQRSVTASALQETTLPDGRLQVAANVNNRENRRIQVQVNCEFKDQQGFAIDSTPWQTLILTENGQETVQFISANTKAKRYTVRVRQAR
jgi:uncharacterized protein YcfL